VLWQGRTVREIPLAVFLAARGNGSVIRQILMGDIPYCSHQIKGVTDAMPPSEISPLARLALFIVCLAIAGSAVATVHYVAIDLPAREASDLQPPANAYWVKCKNCQLACSYDPNPVECLYHCDLIC